MTALFIDMSTVNTIAIYRPPVANHANGSETFVRVVRRTETPSESQIMIDAAKADETHNGGDERLREMRSSETACVVVGTVRVRPICKSAERRGG